MSYTVLVYRYTSRDLDPARRPRTAEARPPGTVLPRGEAFRRDAPTLLCYGAISVYAFWLYAYGPALALLQTELHFSYTVLGVYSALWSVGAVLTGACFARLARRLPRAPLLWSSAAGAVAGAALFAAARTVALTMLGAAMLGFAGTILLTCAQAILSDRHGPRRDRALTEANVGAAGCAVLAPLLLGLLQGTPAGWRPVLALPALVLAGLYLRYRREPLPAGPSGRAARGRLPLSCWLLATMTAIGIAVEFCPIYFGAELLTATGLRAAQAATAMSIFYLGILAGRAAACGSPAAPGAPSRCCGSPWRSPPPGSCSSGLAASPAPAIAGLFLCGLGIANLYPLSLALTLDAGPGHGDTANARVQLLGGVLVIAAPYLLGSLADQLGLRAAFTVEPVLIGACGLLLLAGLRLRA